jgi:hypothetical protein
MVESGSGIKAAFPVRRLLFPGDSILPLNAGDARSTAGAANFS